MGTLPSPIQVARNHNLVYEALYQQVDPAGSDHVAATEAAAFLKRSGLPDGILSKIWDLSDPFGQGFLDKKGFFVALKLIALTQNGKDLSMNNISLDIPPPKMQTCSGRSSPAVDWSLKPSERKKYEEMFNSLGPVSNKLPGQKVKPVMLNSKLPLDVLGKIWDLSDTDQDGFLSKEEFILAMHLIYRALENVPVPSVLPPELAAVLRKKNSLTNIGVPVLPEVLPPSIDSAILVNDIRRSSTPSAEFVNKTSSWVVGASDKAKYDEMFHILDKDVDGFVTGPDIKDTLLQTGLSQPVLAHIWNLCDIKQTGKLNSEQFALTMYLVHQKMQGYEIPAALLPEMIPPTMRPKPSADGIQDISALVMLGEHDSSGNKELDLISNEIKELHEEKMSLEKDIAQKEADVKIKNGELKNLQNELDALETMLKQLEVQKGEARKRLSDLDKQIEAIKKQLEEQELTVESQELELNTKRQELNDMRQEELKLETQINDGRKQLEVLTSTLQGTQLQISQMKLKIDQMQEQHRLMTDAIQQLDIALTSGDVKSISEFTLTAITPIPEAEVNEFSPTDGKNGQTTPLPVLPVDDFKEDPFGGKDPFTETNGFASDPFAGDNPFKSDPFADTSAVSQATFPSDPFDEVFGVTQSNSKDDPFQGSDPFGGFSATAVVSTAKSDPFDPFGLSSNPTSESPVMDSNSDPFGADPFGPSAVTPPQPESPTPALPPKKGKAPPPRPAPPKGSAAPPPPPVKSGPTRAAPAPPLPPANPDPFKIAESNPTVTSQPFPDLFSQPTNKVGDAFDPFSASDGVNAQAGGFANFADFDNLN